MDSNSVLGARASAANPPRVEIPTLAVVICVYAAFGLLTWHHAALPLWITVPAGGFVVAWHGSLQHEVIHGHPTRWRWLNHLMVLPSLWLWLPFGLYRELHLTHHRDPALTDPSLDPESWYLAPETWSRLARPARALRWVVNTAPGRLLLGPLMLVVALVRSQIRAACERRLNARAWTLHALGVAAVLGWVCGICGLSPWTYVAAYVYPGMVLTMLRGFAEHQARTEIAQRTSAVESGPLMSLLYLNNNLHPLHHQHPEIPWYQLPSVWREHRARLLAANGNACYRGYWQVLAQYSVRPRDTPCWPLRVEATCAPHGRGSDNAPARRRVDSNALHRGSKAGRQPA